MNDHSNNIEEQDELYEHYNFTASVGQEPLRVDKFLMNFIEMLYLSIKQIG